MTVRQDLTAANGRIGNSLIAGAGRLASQSFSALGDWRDDDVERYIRQIAPALSGIKRQAAKSTVAFYKAMAELTGQDWKQPVITASDLATKELRNGVGTDLVYKRPFVDMRTVLSQGGTMTDAINAGARRAQSLAETEVQLARRNAGLKVRKANDRIVGYVRTLTGFENCALCYVASTQRYTKNNLLPIHPGCDCGEMPIYGNQDPGQVINEVRLEATHESIAKRFGVSARDAREIDYRAIKITEHGEMGPTLTIRSQATQAAGDVGELFGVGRVIGEISDAEMTSIKNYARTSYRTINSGLRNDWKPNFRNIPDDEETILAFKKEVENLDQVMERSYLSEDLTLYRGARSREFQNLEIDEAQKMVGQTIQDKGFVSTSLDDEFARIGIGVDSVADQVGFIIKAPKGTHGIDINGLKASQFILEKEILLDRNTKFKINKVYDELVELPPPFGQTTKRFIEMEVINE